MKSLAHDLYSKGEGMFARASRVLHMADAEHGGGGGGDDIESSLHKQAAAYGTNYGKYEMSDLLKLAKSHDASDLHIRAHLPPMFRIHGALYPASGPKIHPSDLGDMVRAITSESYITRLKEKGSADFALAMQDGERFRVHVFKERGQLALVLRNIPTKIRTMQELNLPASVQSLMTLPRGLVVVTGPTGSGKTTTLASMIDAINAERSDAHIITLEDPIEYAHKSKKAIVSQREIGIDVGSFAEGIRDSLRANPDIILVGEMRDLETIEAAITAAETGHLVFGTLHTTGAGKTVDRILGVFPEKQQAQIRTQLSTVLQGVVSQLLLPNSSNSGRVAVFEVMTMTPAVANHIRKNEPYAINNEIQTGAKYGMLSLDDSLYEAVKTGALESSLALMKSNDRVTLEARIRKLSGGSSQ